MKTVTKILLTNIVIAAIAITLIDITNANGLGGYWIGFMTFAVMDFSNNFIYKEEDE